MRTRSRMWRLPAQSLERIDLGLGLLLAAAAAEAGPHIAVRIAGKPILLQEVDALARAKVDRIRTLHLRSALA